jgi:hypothetical protein
VTASQFRKIVLGLQGAAEGSHMGHPDFRAANGRIFASLVEDETVATAKLTPEQQADFIQDAPTAFEPAAGAWGRNGWTMITLRNADQESIGEAMTLAWQGVASLPPSKGGAKKKKAKKQARKPRPSR